MKVRFLALLLAAAASAAQAQAVRHWDFNRSGDAEQWSVPSANRGAVMGGSLWVTLAPKAKDAATVASYSYQALGDFGGANERGEEPDIAASPGGLDIAAAAVTQVRLRVLNLSSVTDFFVRWRTQETEWGGKIPATDFGKFPAQVEATEIPPPNWGQPPQSRRCTLRADVKQWQEITCYIDQRWQGTLDQIAIYTASNTARGSLWFDWIEIAKGPAEPVRARPDVASARVVPEITIPGISQAGFAAAFSVLDECMTVDVPLYGFNFPLMTPGGVYTRGGWWQLDAVLALVGAKWANQRFAEDVVRGFIEVQNDNPDGRIDDRGQNGIRGQPADLAVLPKYFEVAFDIARRTADEDLRKAIYESMRKYLAWWLSPAKTDARTGLISGLFEETFDPPSNEPLDIAQVDINVAVAVSAARTAELAARLGRTAEAATYRRVFERIAQTINAYFWDEAAGVYSSYDLRRNKLRPGLSVSTFDPLRLGIAPEPRRARLLKRLLDPAQFNWGRLPLTSWRMTDAEFTNAQDAYGGRWWQGNIWTLRNMTVVEGLEESRYPALAAELNWATIKAFHGNYWESLEAAAGRGRGAKHYAWSASQYLGAVIEHLFGVDYDAMQPRLRIAPHVPKALYGKTLKLERLLLPTQGEARLSVTVKQSSSRAAVVTAHIDGPLPEGVLQVQLPGTDDDVSVPLQRDYRVTFP